MGKRRRFRDGFTLLEALAVVAILVVLAALLFPLGKSMLRSADRAACLTNLRGTHLAARAYYSDHGKFPDWETWPFSAVEEGIREYYYRGPIPPHTQGVATVTTSPVIDRQMRSWNPTRTNYAMNLHASNHQSHGLASMALIERPSRMMHFIYGAAGPKRSDGTYFFTKFVAHLNTGQSPIRRERYYDDGYAQLVFMDGSTGRISREEGEKLNRRNTEESRLFWTGRSGS